MRREGDAIGPRARPVSTGGPAKERDRPGVITEGETATRPPRRSDPRVRCVQETEPWRTGGDEVHARTCCARKSWTQHLDGMESATRDKLHALCPGNTARHGRGGARTEDHDEIQLEVRLRSVADFRARV